MEIVLTCVVMFLLCWLADKGFSKLFRSKPQHHSGRSVRLNKHHGSFGLVFFLLGVACMFASSQTGIVLLIGGIVIALVGVGLALRYLTFGIYYDDSTFLVSSFGKKSKTCRYEEITSQQLFANGGQIIIELYMKDGTAVQLFSTMTDVYAFLDHAFACWLTQTGRTVEECDFHDPKNSCWFPKVEEDT